LYIYNSKSYYGNVTPFGMMMEERSFTSNSSENKFGFNGMEKDDDIQVNVLNYGARIYDARVARWMSVDPLKFKYPYLSPYCMAANKPILLIDPDGKENVIYLVLLDGAKREDGTALTKEDMQEIANRANEKFISLGLETRVVVFEGENFNMEYMDPTDAAAFVGSDEELIKNGYAQGKEYFTKIEVESTLKNRAEVNKEAPGTIKGVDISENSVTNKFGEVPYRMVSGGGNIINMLPSDIDLWTDDLNSNYVDIFVWGILHGAGHNAGLNHDRQDAVDGENIEHASIMYSGAVDTPKIGTVNLIDKFTVRNEKKKI
jgi:RHS repeat-associated protein